jgi:hypothetical protein
MKIKLGPERVPFLLYRADDENRTHPFCLEGRGTTNMQHPQAAPPGLDPGTPELTVRCSTS